ncbi:lipocalin family protein, partial [Citrobacter braakii]|uniref:lipocalin family protein n=1 Tax=Citrobacter braakii TaxID=57706 RepID=UPI0024028400
MGTWYEIARYPVEFQFGQCSRAEYSAGNRVVVSNTEVVNQQLQVQNGFADLASTDGSGLLNVEFVVNGVTTNSPYYILATDYTSYSLVYSCESLANGNRRVSSWKLSRTPTLSAAAVNAMAPLIAS